MKIISYAQNFEDVMLRRALADINEGFYVDVGAAWPEEHSVTKTFYDAGWTGINVEPNPELFTLLATARPRDINLQYAVSSYSGRSTFNVISDSGLSTLDEQVAIRHHQDGWDVKKIDVPVEPLASIFDAHAKAVRDIHFLKIDVEGAEKAVLESNDWSVYRPWIVIVESTLPLSEAESHGTWEPILLSAGYSFCYGDGLNRFYVANESVELCDRFKYPPNVFDDFEIAEVARLRRSNEIASARVLELQERMLALESGGAQKVNWLMQWGGKGMRLVKRKIFGLAAFGKRAASYSFLQVFHRMRRSALFSGKPVYDAAMIRDLDSRISELSKLTNPGGNPNINSLWWLVKDIEILRLNSKNYGYQLARDLQPTLAAIDTSGQPSYVGLVSKPTTQSDVESPWFVYWCQQINAAPIYHRKLWEFAFLLQVLFERDILKSGKRGLGFGCGQEPLASYFASINMEVVVTDLSPDQVAGMGWTETGQHTTAKDQAYYSDIVDRNRFDQNVSHQYIDMNDIPDLGESFDFCWSVCAMEHLGSIEKGLAFVEKSLSVLKPGGVAIHTTEYNYMSEVETLDNWQTVLFRRCDIKILADRLRDSGHILLGPDFYVGSGVLDKFIDVPPYSIGEGWLSPEDMASQDHSGNLKLAIDGFACTCYGIVVIKAEGETA